MGGNSREGGINLIKAKFNCNSIETNSTPQNWTLLSSLSYPWQLWVGRAVREKSESCNSRTNCLPSWMTLHRNGRICPVRITVCKWISLLGTCPQTGALSPKHAPAPTLGPVHGPSPSTSWTAPRPAISSWQTAVSLSLTHLSSN